MQKLYQKWNAISYHRCKYFFRDVIWTINCHHLQRPLQKHVLRDYDAIQFPIRISIYMIE